MVAQGLGVEARAVCGIDGMAGFDGQHGAGSGGQRKSSRRGVKLSISAPGSRAARQECAAPEGTTKRRPGRPRSVAPEMVNAKRPDLTKVDWTCGWLCGSADAVGGEGELDEHEIGAVGEHLAGHAGAGVDAGKGWT